MIDTAGTRARCPGAATLVLHHRGQEVIGPLAKIKKNRCLLRDKNPVENNDERELRELIARWSKTVRHENLAGIRADHDPEMLMFDLPPPLLARGLDAYTDTWKTFFAWSTKPVQYDFHDVQISAGPDVAFATAIGNCCGTERNGQQIQLEFRLTIGFRKRDGRWSIVHEYHSVPATD